MKKFIKDTEILNMFSLYLSHIDVFLMTSYCKNFIGFPSIISENLSFYRNKHNDLKREMTSSRETGGAVDLHKIIILCGYNNSLIEIKRNVSTDRIFKLASNVLFYVWYILCTFNGNINTQKINRIKYQCWIQTDKSQSRVIRCHKYQSRR